MTTAKDFAKYAPMALDKPAPCDCPLCAMWEKDGEGPGPFVNRTLGWKLFRRRKDGTLGPLFINRRQVVPVGEWIEAEDHPTKGYAHRPGWHATLQPVAPHLRQDGDRVWCQVELAEYTPVKRPALQGGTWVLAWWLKVVKVWPTAEFVD